MSAPAPAADAGIPVARAMRCLEQYAEHSSAFLTLNDDTAHFTGTAPGLCAYRTAGRRHVFQLCGPIAPAASRRELLEEFRAWTAADRRRITAVQLSRDEAELYADAGFTVNQLGSSYSIDLARFTLRGRRFVKTRNMINVARKSGVEVHEVRPGSPGNAALEKQLDAIDHHWLRAKGRHVKQLTFMVGERDGRGKPYRRLFAATYRGDVVGYVTFSPVFGARHGWLYDLTRRSPEAPRGVIETVFAHAAQVFTDEGAGWLHLGFTPFAGLGDEHELAGHSPAGRRIISLVAAHGQAVYPARAQESFKLKWQPQAVQPEYIAFDGRLSLSAVIRLLLLTRAI